MGSTSGSNSNQEFGLQAWWHPERTPGFMEGAEELSSVPITVIFHANLKDSEYKHVRTDLTFCGIDNDNVTRDVNVIRVTGYDQAMLKGQQVLGIFQKYDRQARRM